MSLSDLALMQFSGLMIALFHQGKNATFYLMNRKMLFLVPPLFALLTGNTSKQFV
jgi:hypothetical protein